METLDVPKGAEDGMNARLRCSFRNTIKNTTQHTFDSFDFGLSTGEHVRSLTLIVFQIWFWFL